LSLLFILMTSGLRVTSGILRWFIIWKTRLFLTLFISNLWFILPVTINVLIPMDSFCNRLACHFVQHSKKHTLCYDFVNITATLFECANKSNRMVPPQKIEINIMRNERFRSFEGNRKKFQRHFLKKGNVMTFGWYESIRLCLSRGLVLSWDGKPSANLRRSLYLFGLLRDIFLFKYECLFGLYPVFYVPHLTPDEVEIFWVWYR
jgi:hypothetical protein